MNLEFKAFLCLSLTRGFISKEKGQKQFMAKSMAKDSLLYIAAAYFSIRQRDFCILFSCLSHRDNIAEVKSHVFVHANPPGLKVSYQSVLKQEKKLIS